MQETVNWSSKLTFSRERWSGIAPVNVKNVSESHQIIRQTDSGFGVEAREGPGWFPWGLISTLPISPLPHTLCHVWDSPCWLPASPPFLFLETAQCSSVTSFWMLCWRILTIWRRMIMRSKRRAPTAAKPKIVVRMFFQEIKLEMAWKDFSCSWGCKISRVFHGLYLIMTFP